MSGKWLIPLLGRRLQTRVRKLRERRFSQDFEAIGAVDDESSTRWRPGSASTGWVVTFWSVTSMCGSLPLAVRQWSQKPMTSRFWVALARSALA